MQLKLGHMRGMSPKGLKILALLGAALLLSSCGETPSSPSSSSDSHIHTYGEYYQSDATYHWHEVTCGHEEASDKAAHSYDPSNTYCEECGYGLNNAFLLELDDESQVYAVKGFAESFTATGEITLPSECGGYPITSIGDSAFSYQEGITYFEIPVSVTDIGSYPFAYCNKLSYVGYQGTKSQWEALDASIGRLVKCSDGYAPVESRDAYVSSGVNYRYLTSSECWTISDVDTSVAEIIFPEDIAGYPIESIEQLAFQDCVELTSLTIPDSIDSIGDFAFRNCAKLIDIHLPSSLTSLAQNAFRECSSLASISIPAFLTEIPRYCFVDCESLVGVSFENEKNVASIGYQAFYGCESLTSFTLPSALSSLGEESFRDCFSLTSFTFNQKINSVPVSAFVNCSSLTELTLPQNLKSISSRAFVNCSGLSSFVLPSGVTSIGREAFSGCNSLTDVYYAGTPTSGSSMSIESGNAILKNAAWHYYSVNDPETSGYDLSYSYWHYVDGVPTLW